MALHPLAGQPQPAEQRINVPALMTAYYRQSPDVANNPAHKVSFGTSGHRGCALNQSFNEAHILAITQAIVEYRQTQGLKGPIYIGKDTHALSEAAFISVVEVLVGNGVRVRIDKDLGFTPTPVISHAVLTHNAAADTNDLSDGIVITPSHNPPQDGGIKYNTAKGGPADVDATGQIAERANALLENNLEGVQRAETPLDSTLIERFDFIDHYVGQLDQVVDMKAIANAGIKIGIDPMGGSGLRYWQPIAKRYGLNIELINEDIDPRFAFMPLDKDGKVRMDCSSPYAMANLLKLQSQFDIAVGNDPDYDRHGIVCHSHGLMNPNHYLAVAINYLTEHRSEWKANVQIGKTLVSSAMIDRVVAAKGRTLCEVPVGFKWYVAGMFAGELAFGGEESAGASFLRKDGTVWSTDKDGFILALLAAEILAVTGKDPAEHYDALTQQHGNPIYKRIDVPTTLEAKQRLSSMDTSAVTSSTLAGQPITRVLTNAPGNNAPIGGLKVETADGWFAARPSGTENLYKIYLESFVSEEHLQQLEADATQLVDSVLNG